MPDVEYRVVRRRDVDGEDYNVFLVKEESDDETYEVRSSPIAFAAGSLEGLKQKLDRLQRALGRPVLDYDSLQFPAVRKPSRVEALHNTTSVIPEGDYCYSWTDSGRLICPYLDTAPFRPEQSSGYCWFMGKGDFDFQREGHLGLLWDEVKECGVNAHVPTPEENAAHDWIFETSDAFIAAHPGINSIDVEFRVNPVSGRTVAIVEAINHMENRVRSPFGALFGELEEILATGAETLQQFAPDSGVSACRRTPAEDGNI